MSQNTPESNRKKRNTKNCLFTLLNKKFLILSYMDLMLTVRYGLLGSPMAYRACCGVLAMSLKT